MDDSDEVKPDVAVAADGSTMRLDGRRSTASLLFDLVLGDSVRARSSAEFAGHHQLWPTLMHTARAWRVLPPLAETIRTTGVELSTENRAALRGELQVAAAQSTLVAHHAATLLASLASGGIDAVPFKGVALIAGLYGGPAPRMVGDIDLLVPERSIEAVGDLLLVRGLRPCCYASLEEFHVDRLGARANNASLPFRDSDGIEVDLHWRLSERTDADQWVESILARAVEGRLMGRVIRVPSPADAMLLSVHHAVRSDMPLASLLKDLRDVLCWCLLRQGSWSGEDLLEQAGTLEIEPAVLACWIVLARVNHAPALAAGVEFFSSKLTADQRRLATAIAELILHRIEQGRINQDLVALYQEGALRRWIRARVLNPRTVAQREPNRATGILRRLLRLIVESVRQRGFERTGYRALATVRERLMGSRQD